MQYKMMFLKKVYIKVLRKQGKKKNIEGKIPDITNLDTDTILNA